jgi:hypothetical protein
MSRFAAQQSDLFAPVPGQSGAEPRQDNLAGPIAELNEMLALVRAADRLPWPDLPAAMAWEYRALFLARQGCTEGHRLASSIMDETERLFAAQEREQLEARDGGRDAGAGGVVRDDRIS